MEDEDVRALRDQLVDRLLKAGRIRTGQVAEAFRVVPRHLFLPGAELATAYTDEAIVTRWEPAGRSAPPPSRRHGDDAGAA